MMEGLATPVGLIESHFGFDLTRRNIAAIYDRVSAVEWIHFARDYRTYMRDHFASDFIAPSRDATRLYFDQDLQYAFDDILMSQQRNTPLLSVGGKPPAVAYLTTDDVSALLNPLKKHLLMSDAVFVRDNFSYCFDEMAEYESDTMPIDTTRAAVVERAVQAIRGWLPILADLRTLIRVGALVMYPYYVTPSFPYSWSSPSLKPFMRGLKARPGIDYDGLKPAGSAHFDPDVIRQLSLGEWHPTDLSPAWDGQITKDGESEGVKGIHSDNIIGAWLNARIMGLDPIFPTRRMAEFAGRFYLDDGEQSADLCSDLISISVVSVERESTISVADIETMRMNDSVFAEIRATLADCEESLRRSMREDADQTDVTRMCQAVVRDRLGNHEKRNVLRIADENPAAGVFWQGVVGVALAPLHLVPLASILAERVLDPKLWLAAKRRTDVRNRAYARVQAIL